MIPRLQLALTLPLALVLLTGLRSDVGGELIDIEDEDGGAQVLTSGTSTSALIDTQTYSIEQTRRFWSAVGVRPLGADDWDIRVYDAAAKDAAQASADLSGIRASSVNSGGVDFIVGDFNHDPLGRDYVRVNRQSGADEATVEWEGGGNFLIANGPTVSRATGPSDVLEVWDVFLEAGVEYTFSFQRFGAADAKMVLFRNPSSSPYWVGRSSREFEVTATTTYVAGASDWYGVVVVNDNGAEGSYALAVGPCVAPTALSSGVSVSTPGTNGYYSFTQQSIYWSAVAVRGLGTSDWDLRVYGTGIGAPWPECFSNSLAASVYGAGYTDFVIGDFNHAPLGTYYARSYLYSGPDAARTEWDDGADQLVVNAPMITRNTDANDLIEVWDVYLEASVGYWVLFRPSGNADLKVLMFGDLSGNGYWAGRSSAILEYTSDFTISSSGADWFTVVVVNDNGGTGSYSLEVGRCDQTVALTSGASVFTPAPAGHYSIGQFNRYWTAVGTRSLNADWDIGAYSEASGNSYPTCFGNLLAISNAGAQADFIVGDFSHNPFGTYYFNPYSSGGNAVTEWDDGADEIRVGDPPISRNTNGSDVLEIWDVSLQEQRLYDIYFSRSGADTKLYLYQSQNGVYWAGRYEEVLETTDLHTMFRASADDWYGLVVVNDDGGTGSYQVGISLVTSAVDGAGALPSGPSLLLPSPNPSSGNVRFGFALDREGPVSLDVLDVSGRVVAALPSRTWPAGTWQSDWNGRMADGRTALGGVYWVRMATATAEVGRRRFVLVR